MTQKILRKYGLSKETTMRYLDVVVRKGPSDAIEELDVARETLYKYRRAFDEMSRAERVVLMAELLGQRRAAFGSWLEKQSGESS